MNSLNLNKLQDMLKRYREIQKIFSNASVTKNQKLLRELSHEHAYLESILHYFNIWQKLQQDIEVIQKMLDDKEMHDIAQEELNKIKLYANSIENKIKVLLLPKDLNDNRNVFIEIRAGTGGNEAALFAKDLFRMYSRYSELRDWQVEIININEIEYGGYKEIVAKISGFGVYKNLKFESGGHRVQRIPITESQGRIQTSTCTVAVIPESPTIKLPNISASDIRIDTFKSSGSGGQHVNKTDSAIRVTHLPTGIVVECQDERSQHKNKARALAVLNARIQAEEIEKRKRNESLIRRNLLGSGDRNSRNRTYNFPKKRITDHRINLTLYCLDEIMEGKLDKLIDPIIHKCQINLLNDNKK